MNSDTARSEKRVFVVRERFSRKILGIAEARSWSRAVEAMLRTETIHSGDGPAPKGTLNNLLGSSAPISGVGLHFADLRHTDLRGAYLPNADLQTAYLSHADLSDADLVDADLSDADLSEANLHGAFLLDIKLRSARLSNGDLSGATLLGADLAGADLRGADLRTAELAGACFGGADLRGADFRGTDLRDDIFGRTNLDGALLDGAVISMRSRAVAAEVLVRSSERADQRAFALRVRDEDGFLRKVFGDAPSSLMNWARTVLERHCVVDTVYPRDTSNDPDV